MTMEYNNNTISMRTFRSELRSWFLPIERIETRKIVAHKFDNNLMKFGIQKTITKTTTVADYKGGGGVRRNILKKMENFFLLIDELFSRSTWTNKTKKLVINLVVMRRFEPPNPLFYSLPFKCPRFFEYVTKIWN